jgi:ATP-dependent helicase HrpB
MQPLPIDSLLPQIIASLRRAPNLVIEAPPGAGKTTRVPPALLDAGLAGAGEVLVLEPRRLAARLSARRVAEERGERLGERIGYQVRFEEVAGPRTRLRFLTEGVLTRRLLADPQLRGVGVVALDEFHERHLQADLALALLRRLQQTARPDLRLVVMSATLEAAPVARFLGDAPTLRAEGRRFEVAIEHLARPDQRPLEEQVEAAVRRLLADGLAGDVLVFLPGAAEIRRAQAACAKIAAQSDLLVLPLHGDLPAAEQDRAVRPLSEAGRRKLILSTNVAETSVTIDGVAAVIDSGLARIAEHSPWSGLPTLNVARISQASATQRAGRAGRTRHGRCLRLYTAPDFAARPEHAAPEIERLDLAEAALELHAAGSTDLNAFAWFEAPPPPALAAAETLLRRLGALDDRGDVTPLGRRMLRLPLHPRQSRLLVEAQQRGVAREGCLIAALVGERDIRAVTFQPRENTRSSGAVKSGPSDLLELVDLFLEAERANFAPARLCDLGMDPGATLAVERVRRQLERLLGAREQSGTVPGDEELLISILAGYPDRVARRRLSESAKGGGADLLLSGGGAAQLSPNSVVRQAELMVAVDIEERRDRKQPAPFLSPGASAKAGARASATIVRLASAIEPEWLLDLFAESLAETTEAQWNAQAERVEVVRRLLYDQLVLDEKREREASGEEVTRVLASAALAAGPSAFTAQDEIARFLARVEFLARAFPEAGVPALVEQDARDALAALCEGKQSFAELRAAARHGGLLDMLRRRLTPAQARLLAQMAPERVPLGRRQVRVNYESGKEPWIAARLQDFFGMMTGPRIADGRVPLVLHLLAPNQRPVQVTTDLAGFWARIYPQARRELSRRYPRHAWPENPLATARGRRT